MGSVMRKRVVNVYDVPQDVLVNFVGRGLEMNREEAPVRLEVCVGTGLDFNDSSEIVVDDQIDEKQCTTMTHCVNTALSLDGRRLTLTKTLADYKVKRNQHGHIIDIEHTGDRIEKDELILTDLGYMSALSVPNRDDTKNFPNFYKK